MIAWQALDVGNHRVPCPSCGRGPKDRALGVTVERDGKGIAHCFRCQFTETYRVTTPTHRPGKAVSRPVARLKRERLSAWGAALWEACKPISGPARDYLQARGCVIPPHDSDLKWHESLRHPSGGEGPALVGLVTDAVTGGHMSLHRSWVRPDGTKAFDPPRLLLGGHRKAGGVIRLWPDEAVTYSLAVAEGIETALSLAHGHAPVWACIDAGNLAALPVLGGIECLVIGADADDAGMAAATACADRWAAADVDVRIVAPSQHKADLNDVLLGRAA